MTWAQAKAEVVSILGTCAITSPITETIEHVYPDPPGTIRNTPCFVLYPPSVETEHLPSGWRVKDYVLRVRFLGSAQNLETGAAILDAFRESLIDLWSPALQLNLAASDVQGITGPDIEEAAEFEYAGVNFAGFDALLGIKLSEARALSA